MKTPIDRIPPFICRALARDKARKRALTVREICDSSGLGKTMVQRLSKRISWEGIPVDVAFKFATACSVNLMRPNGHLKWRKKHWRGRDSEMVALVQEWIREIS